MRFWTEKRILWGFILFYIIFFGIFTSLRHYNFQTQTWDMGIFVQTFWNTIHGNIMQNSIEEIKNHFGVHMSPWLFVLTPGYVIFPSPYYLLIIQTLIIALGAWPLYLLAKKLLARPWPLILAAGYLFYPALHWINIFDFHPIAFLPPLLITAFYFLEEKRWPWSALFLTLSASTQEDAILIVLFVGIYLLFKGSAERKFGLAVILLSAFYFLLSTQIIMPALGGGLLRLDRYSQFGSTAPEIVKNIFLQPKILAQTLFKAEKFRYLLWLFLPVAFLPFFSRTAFILLVPGLLENLLTNFNAQFTGFYQYDSILVPAIFISSIFGIKNLLSRRPKYASQLKWLLILTIAAGYLVRSPVNPVFFPAGLFQSNPHWSAFRQMIKSVPPDATVAAQTNLVPHLANRKSIYMLNTEPFPPDFILIDALDDFGFLGPNDLQQYILKYANSGLYETEIINERYLILKKVVK
jgi:uncharacterized membrane protein